jgi:molybdenum cofactor cytidylyltransferase
VALSNHVSDPEEEAAILNADRYFAVIPAAGVSRRTEPQHKLLLPWGHTTIIEHVLTAWINSRVDGIVLVCRGQDEQLANRVRGFATIDLVLPDQPPRDMKESIRLGLRHLKHHPSLAPPRDCDRWLIAPADLPTLSSALIDEVIESGRNVPSIVAPRFGERGGHPVSFPFSLERDIDRLDENDGINRLLERHPVHWLTFAAEQFPHDVDTLHDYRRLSESRDGERSP